ncbi:hypothetical protein HDV02_002587 [Globomyces sp. JEL0801]|nr:hypothetical protein HDV02_002587 [Globomyces sp. JEL0801]
MSKKEGVQSCNRHNGLGTKKRSFSLAEKLEFLKILEQALLDNPKGAFTRVATKHNISKRNLSRWRKDTSLNKVILTQDNMLKRKFTTGRGVDKEKEQFVVDYVLSRRESKLPVNGNIIALAMKKK